jgi:hypothetical protein
MVERAAIFAFALVVCTAQAQEPGPGDTVANRARPEVDGVEHRLGAFMLSSTIALSSELDDNIYADATGAVADRADRLEPAFALESNWTKHALELGGRATGVRYVDHPAEDHENGRLWLDARLDVRESSLITAALRLDREHEGRDSPDDEDADGRTLFFTEFASLSYSNHGARLGVDVSAESRTLDFDDGFRAADATRINNDDRDRRDVRATTRLSVRLGPDYGVFVQASAGSLRYDQQFDDRGFERSSDGTEYAVGFSMDHGVVFGDFYVGHRSQQYDDARFSTIEGASFGGQLTWNVTRLTSLTASARRSVDPTTIVGVSGVDATSVALAADHELRRNVIVSLRLAERTEAFKGRERTDDIPRAAIMCRYLVNRRLHVVAGYTRERRSSTGAERSAFEYSRGAYLVQLQGYL